MTLDHWPRVLGLRLRSLLRPSAVDHELDEELRYHLERQVELNVAGGMDAEAAREAALRSMGNLTHHQEECRDQRRVALAENLIRDSRFGVRLLGRSPIFTTVALLSLALGIGANAAFFQLIDTVRLRSLQLVHPEELAEIRPDGPQAFGSYESVNARATYPLWELIRAHQGAFSGLFAWGDAQFPVGHGAEARSARGLWVSGELFPVLGILPERGRLLGPEDDQRGCGAGAAVISHAFWQTALGGRDAAIGSTLQVLDQPFTVVGIVPPSFTGLEVGQGFDIALPTCSEALFDSRLDQRDRWWLTVMGRLKPDWTVARANEHLRALSPGLLEAAIPPGYDGELIDSYRRLRFGVLPAARGVSRLRDAEGTSLSLLLGLTGLVLLMTCGNLATLVLARASVRAREMAMRVALGASRARLLSQMLVESLLLAAGGAFLAVPVALVSGRALVAFLDTPASPVELKVAPDWRLVGFVALVAALAVVLFGLLPALRASRVDPVGALGQASRGQTLDRRRARFQRALVIAQIAVSLVLTFSGLVFVQTFRNLAAVDPGFDPDHTLAVLFADRASADLPAERKAAFQEELTAAIREVPGVLAAAPSTHVPLSGSIWSHFFHVAANAPERKASRFAYVGPGYFATLRVPVRFGRDFGPGDTARSARVMLVNQSFVRSHLGGRPPIGARVRTIAEPGFPETTYEIVGVVGDTKYADLREENCWCDRAGEVMAPIAYVPLAQIPSPYAWASVIVRTDSSAGVASAIREKVKHLGPAIAVDFLDLRGQVRERLHRERMIAWLAGAFGALAISLVAIGLYGIVAYRAATRRNEIGIRLALGSTPRQIMALVLRDNAVLVGTGLAIGIPITVATTRAASALLFGLTATDGTTMAAACLLLTAAAGFTAAVPAWRAARLRPDEALRCD